jgi:hypothetical protein
MMRRRRKRRRTMTPLVVVMKLAWKCTAGIATAFYREHLPTQNSLGNTT